MKSLSVILFLLTTIVFQSCNRCDGLDAYRFAIPTGIYPAKDTFSIGDTMWIEQKFNDELPSIDNGKSYPLNAIDLELSYSFVDLNTEFPPSRYRPYLILDEVGKTTGAGVGSSEGGKFHINHEIKDEIYHYKAAVILDKKGLYILSFGTLLNGLTSRAVKCKNRYELSINTNNRVNNNYKFLNSSVDTLYYGKMTKETFDRWGSYCFYVK